MSYLGSWAIDDALTFYANTTRFDTGAATDADSAPAYRVYEDETGTPLLTGTMALLDSSNTAGFYSEQITLSAANGFEAGKCYSIYIAATVNSVAGATHKTFQVLAKVTTHTVTANAITAAALASDAGGEIADAVWDEDATGHQTGGTFGQAIGDPGADTTTIYQSVVTDAAGANIAADIIDIEGKVDDLEARLGTPTDLGSGATVAANLVDIESQTDDIASKASQASVDTIDGIVDAILVDTAEIGAAGAGLTAINLPDQTMNITGNITGNLSGSVGSVTGNVGGNVTGSVGSVAANGITAASLAADASAEIADAVWDEQIDEHLASGTTGLALDNAGAAGTPPTPEEIADQVWDEARADHVGAGSFGQGVASVQGNVTGSAGSVTGNVGGNVTGSVGSVVGAVGSVTGNVGGNVVGSVASVTAKVTPVDADGMTYVSAMEFLLAVLGGVADPDGSDVAFKKRDGTTTKVTITYGDEDGERTASVVS